MFCVHWESIRLHALRPLGWIIHKYLYNTGIARQRSTCLGRDRAPEWGGLVQCVSNEARTVKHVIYTGLLLWRVVKD